MDMVIHTEVGSIIYMYGDPRQTNFHKIFGGEQVVREINVLQRTPGKGRSKCKAYSTFFQLRWLRYLQRLVVHVRMKASVGIPSENFRADARPCVPRNDGAVRSTGLDLIAPSSAV